MSNEKFSIFSMGSMVVPAPISFTESSTKVPGVKSEYYISNSGVKFHFFGDPEMPEDLGSLIKKALKNYPKDSVFAEYVPEVDSWYAHIQGLSVGLSPALVEGIIKKIAAQVGKLHE